MNYKLKNGKIVKMHFWDLLESELENSKDYSRGEIEGLEVDEDNNKLSSEFSVKLLKDKKKNKLYFEYENEKIYIKDLKYLPFGEIIEDINNNESVSNEILVSTLIRYADDVAFLVSSEELNAKLTQLSKKHYIKSNIKNVLCVPIEDHYNRAKWANNIELVPVDQYEKFVYGRQSYYMSDFSNSVFNKNVTILSKEEALVCCKNKNISNTDIERTRKLNK